MILWWPVCQHAMYVCKRVCTLTWKYHRVWSLSISRSIIHSVTHVRSCCKVHVKTYWINALYAIKFYHLQKQVLMLQENIHIIDNAADCRKLEGVLCSPSSSFSVWLFFQGQCVAAAYLYIETIGSTQSICLCLTLFAKTISRWCRWGWRHERRRERVFLISFV